MPQSLHAAPLAN